MKKLKLKKVVISSLSSTEQERINGGIDQEMELFGSRAIYCGSNNVCSKSCKALVCI